MSFGFKKQRRHYSDEGEEVSPQQGFTRNYHGDRVERGSPGAWKVPRGDTYGKKTKRKWQEELSAEFVIVKSPNKPRSYTVSIAVPASILVETCIKDSLRTYVVGQIARAANIYSVDEIVVFDDKCWKKSDVTTQAEIKDFIEMMQLLLEYQECPQYLRKHLFQFHHHLKNVGVLNALNSPHHLRVNQWCEYREGVVLDKSNKSASYVDIGLGTDVFINQPLQSGLRVTVHLPPEAREVKRPYGTVVSPDEPREKAGYYWGYTVRVANSLSEVVAGSRFPDGYDLLIGTSDKGEDVATVDLSKFEHALIVFGGVEGLESALEADSDLEATEPQHLFDFYVNTCPMQQTRTVRTEEAVLITLCQLQGKLVGAQQIY